VDVVDPRQDDRNDRSSPCRTAAVLYDEEELSVRVRAGRERGKFAGQRIRERTVCRQGGRTTEIVDGPQGPAIGSSHRAASSCSSANNVSCSSPFVMIATASSPSALSQAVHRSSLSMICLGVWGRRVPFKNLADRTAYPGTCRRRRACRFGDAVAGATPPKKVERLITIPPRGRDETAIPEARCTAVDFALLPTGPVRPITMNFPCSNTDPYFGRPRTADGVSSGCRNASSLPPRAVSAQHGRRCFSPSGLILSYRYVLQSPIDPPRS